MATVVADIANNFNDMKTEETKMINNMVIFIDDTADRSRNIKTCCNLYSKYNIPGYVCDIGDSCGEEYTLDPSTFKVSNPIINASILLPPLSVSSILVDTSNVQAFTNAYYSYLDSNVEVQRLLCNFAISLFEGNNIFLYISESEDMFENQLFQYLANWGFTIYTVDQVLAGQAPVNIDKVSAPKIAQKIAMVTGNNKYVNLFCTNQIPAPQPQAISQQQVYPNQNSAPIPQPQVMPQQQNFNYATQQQVYPNQNLAQQQIMQNIDPQVQQQIQQEVHNIFLNHLHQLATNSAPQPQAIPQSNNATPPVERTPFTRCCQMTPEQREQLYQETLKQFGMNVRPNIVTPEQQMMMMQNTSPAPQYDPNAVPF